MTKTQKKLRSVWGRGEKTELARRCRVAPSYISYVLRGRRAPKAEFADKMATEAFKMGLALHRDDLLYPRESANPLLEMEDDECSN